MATEKTIIKKLREEIHENRAVVDIFDEMLAENHPSVVLRDHLAVHVIPNMALKVDPSNPDDQLLIDAFATCNLDWKKPLHWRLLLNSLVSVCFHKSGAHEKWDDLAFFKLASDIQTLQKAEPALATDSDIAKRLQSSKLFGSKYKNFGKDDKPRKNAVALAKLVGKARRWASDYLNEPDLGIALLKRNHEAAAKKWTNEYEQHIRPLAETIWDKLLARMLQERFMTAVRKKHEELGWSWSEQTQAKYDPIVRQLVRDKLGSLSL